MRGVLLGLPIWLARYVRAPLDSLFEHRTERTRVLFMSHLTSETALLLPIEPLVARPA